MHQMTKLADSGDDPRSHRPSPQAAEPRRYDTTDLFRGAMEIEIVHQGSVYRLKITRQGKLILNK